MHLIQNGQSLILSRVSFTRVVPLEQYISVHLISIVAKPLQPP